MGAAAAGALALPAAAGAIGLPSLPAGLNSRGPKDEPVGKYWESVDLGLEEGVLVCDVGFVPDQPGRGFVVGSRETLQETKDGGKTWVPVDVSGVTGDDIKYRLSSVSFEGKEGWIVGKPALLLRTSDGGDSWTRVPLSPRLPGIPVSVHALPQPGFAEMATDQGGIYFTDDGGQNWKGAVAETVEATLNRTVSSGISGASYYTGSFSQVDRSPLGDYLAVSTRGNFYMTWKPGQGAWFPHNRYSARRIQGMGFRKDGGLWMSARGGELYFGSGEGTADLTVEDPDFVQTRVPTRGFALIGVGYRTDEEVWAVGGSGSLFRSADGGESWKRERAADDLPGNLYNVKFMGSGEGFVLGSDGILLRYIGA